MKGQIDELESDPDSANRWARIASAEHASIASFAQFVIQLLHVGAPARLIKEAARAIDDEIRHAEIAIRVAKSFGYTGNIGKLNTLGVNSEFGGSISNIANGAFWEGCVEELTAARQLECASLRSDNATLGSLLYEIYEDELRHSELAWHFLDWAAGRYPEVSNQLPEFLGLLEDRSNKFAIATDDIDSESGKIVEGLLPETTKRRLAHETITNEIIPRLRTMTEKSAPQIDQLAT